MSKRAFVSGCVLLSYLHVSPTSDAQSVIPVSGVECQQRISRYPRSEIAQIFEARPINGRRQEVTVEELATTDLYYDGREDRLVRYTQPHEEGTMNVLAIVTREAGQWEGHAVDCFVEDRQGYSRFLTAVIGQSEGVVHMARLTSQTCDDRLGCPQLRITTALDVFVGRAWVFYSAVSAQWNRMSGVGENFLRPIVILPRVGGGSILASVTGLYREVVPARTNHWRLTGFTDSFVRAPPVAYASRLGGCVASPHSPFRFRLIPEQDESTPGILLPRHVSIEVLARVGAEHSTRALYAVRLPGGEHGFSVLADSDFLSSCMNNLAIETRETARANIQ